MTTRERSNVVFVRRDNDVGAMSWDMRLRRRVKSVFGGGRRSDGEFDKEPGDGNDNQRAADADQRPVQYRLDATSRQTPWSLFKCIFTCGVASYMPRVGVNPNQKLAMSLHWMFRVNFFFLFVVMCMMFFALVIFFTLFIIIAGLWVPECVRIGGDPFTESGTTFANGFALSWTTFSTVGYGSSYPALGYQNDNPSNCFFINFVLSLEALVGVLYAGFCGAILFGKVLRIQSHAQVVFSDPIVIRYGTGLESDADDNRDSEKGGYPCPVLEFRIVNRLFDEVGGEIMDATLNVVANVDANDAESINESSASLPSDSIRDTATDDSDSESESTRPNTPQGSTHGSQLGRMLYPLRTLANRRDNNNQRIVEDSSSRLASKQVFSKMVIEAADHPFFKRVWLARHHLDEFSPIVKQRVRRQIKRNGGHWPERLNNYAAIRESLQFNQILVSLNGVSNVSACSCYAQRIYDFVDVNIGYQFVNLLYRDFDNSLGVDIDLINDVREQNGGGGEPLITG